MHRQLISLIILIACNQLSATHNRAGEIRFRQINDLTIIAELVTYTKTSSISADRDTIFIMWGDGTSSSVPRENGKGFILANDIKMNIYEMQHTYPGRGEYLISMFDPNRIENILNVDPPNSVNIPFFIQTTIKLFNSNFQGLNQSPILTNPPIDIACLGQIFIHNPGATDPDGDSLSFSLTQPLMDINTPVPNYLFPNQIRPGLNNLISMDPKTGTFTWNSPQLEGEYNIAIEIREYRRGQLIGTVIRDMQILVLSGCQQDSPPSIEGPADTCIIAGTILDLNFGITDPDAGRKGGRVKTQAFGAPFVIAPTATTNAKQDFELVPYNFNFNWHTACAHIRKDDYNLIIKSTDNFYDTSGLSNTFIYKIKVIGPPPLDPQSLLSNGAIEVSWQYPYSCDSSGSEFRGFSVWRRETPGPKIDTCITGLENYGYSRLVYLTKEMANNRYFFRDTSALKTHRYCYRVQAEFASITSSGFLYNFTSSMPSDEVCSEFLTNEPLILNVDVATTDIQKGSISVKFQKPFVPGYDTAFYHGPYTVNVFSKENQGNYNIIPSGSRVYSNFSEFWDTTLLHDNINTKNNFYNYKIEISTSAGTVTSEQASQIRLEADNFNKSIRLKWYSATPWNNIRYTIYRSTDKVNFDSIGSSSTNQFIDNSIQFDSSYCYYILGYGRYFDSRIEYPLLNHSNLYCIIAADSTPPCCPILSIEGPCETNDKSDLVRLRLWFNEDSCSSRDIRKFVVFEKNFDVIRMIADSLPTTSREIQIKPSSLVKSCFLFTAYNAKNISCTTDLICIPQCPDYVLPNTFTPNGDNHNDLFRPIINRQVTSVEFKVINKWGNMVFATSDPELNWDGRDLNGTPLSVGTYYYSCRLHFLNDADSRELTGFIELLK